MKPIKPIPQKPMPGMQNRPGKMTAPKPAMPMKPKPESDKGSRPAMRMTSENAKKRAAEVKREAFARALRRLGKGKDV
jgi:hypothetical protein